MKKKQALKISDKEFKKLPEVIKLAETKQSDIPIFRYVHCEKYAQDILVNFHCAPISRMRLPIKEKKDGTR